MRPARTIRLALAAALLSLAATPARAPAQNGVTATPPASTTTTGPVASDSATGAPLTAAPAASSESSGLPAHAGPPRTLRAYWHVFAAFTIAWLLVFGYALSLGRRFARLEREIGAGAAS
ncbi:MAG TPA: CcmD family protein [Longimicrobium sp.]|nr:CcmD family protein [Longimicrobium sp.]